MLLLNEKVKLLDIREKIQSCTEVAKIHSRNESSICENEKRKELHGSFSVIPWTEKVTATEHGKYLVEMKKL